MRTSALDKKNMNKVDNEIDIQMEKTVESNDDDHVDKSGKKNKFVQ